MMLKHDAIYALYPNVVSIKNDVAYDVDDNVVEYDEKLVDDWIVKNSYFSKRKDEYPSIADQLDMIWHSINNNEPIDKNSPFFISLKNVKDKHPKA